MVKLIFAGLICTVMAAAGCAQDDGCESAYNAITQAMVSVCAGAPYNTSSFCITCVGAGYYSNTGPTECACKTLAFDETSCTVPSDNDVMAQVRSAIDYAMDSCAAYRLPSADAGIDDAKSGDSRTVEATVDAGEDGQG
jgi:hypothetical protein